MSSKTKVIITGATGYLGSNIVNALHDKYEFIVFKRRTSKLDRIERVASKLKMYDIEDINETTLLGINCDIILHCATDYGRKNSAPIEILEANLLMPLKLVALLQKLNKKIKFINTDTILDKHISAYSLSKNQFKEWMIFFSTDFVFINVQLEHFYGPKDDKTKFVSFLINAFINNESKVDLTKGEQYRYFTYISDVVSAFDVILANNESLTAGLNDFQVSSDNPIRLKDFVLLVKEIACNSTTTLNFGSIPYRDGELMNFNIDNSKMKELGWLPKIELREGLNTTIENEIKYKLCDI